MGIQQDIAQKEYGAEQGLKQNIREGLKGVGFTEPSASTVNQPLMNIVKQGASKANANLGATPAGTSGMDTSFGATPSATTTKITPPSIDAVSRPEGDPNFFRGGAKFEGNSLTSTGIGTGMSKEDLADWKARGDLQNSSYYDGKNPNDDKFAGLMKDLIDTASSGSPSVERATKLNALKTGIQALAPMTSFGQFGVAGLQAETTRRGQDIGADTTKRGQDIGAGTIRRGQDIGAEAKTSELALQAKDLETLARLRGATAAKSQAEANILNEQGKPDKVREREATGWLAERRKVINASLADLEGLPEEEKTKKMNARVADYNKYNPPPIRSAKKNADGTVTVQYADGSVKTGKPVK